MVNKIKKMANSKAFLVGSILLLVIAVILTGTYAWFTWRAPSEPRLTMSIGEIADVTFETGPDLVTKNLAPVYNYTDGEYVDFSIVNKDATESMVIYYVNLKINEISPSLESEDFKYVLTTGNSEILAEGNFADANSGDTISIVSNMPLSSGTTNFRFYIYIDGNVENDSSMMNQEFSATIEVGAEEQSVTPYTDFIYYLGDENPTLTSVNYRNADGTMSSIATGANINSNEILLVQYIGESPIVTVPDTYTIRGKQYNVTIFSCIQGNTNKGVFSGNTNITSVTLGENITIVFSAPGAGYQRNQAYYLFYGCTNLESVPIIPKTLNLLNYMFQNCKSLTGDVVIKSSSISSASNVFTGTVKPITVRVPTGSTTYTTLSKLTPTNGMPTNVTLDTIKFHLRVSYYHDNSYTDLYNGDVEDDNYQFTDDYLQVISSGTSDYEGSCTNGASISIIPIHYGTQYREQITVSNIKSDEYCLVTKISK